jgi:gliding motility-associated-like protein
VKHYFSFIVLLIFINPPAFTQCSPTVIFKEDFGTGAAATGNPLGNTVTAYTFDPTGSLADGEYTIRKTAAPLDGSQIYPTWHTGFDHTGNGGYMMVVNASFSAGKFYETRIDNLCSGTSIKFSAWIANLLKLGSPDPLDPDVKFEIKSAVSGTVLGTYTTGKINRYTSYTWEQYGFDILLPPGETSVILTMYNNQVGGAGNDLALDDIEFSVCGAESSPFLTGTYQSSNTVCSNQPVIINGNIIKQVYNNPTFQWQSSADSINWVNISGATQQDYIINNASAGDSKYYRLLISEPANINAPNCRSVSRAVKLNVFNPLPVSIQHKNIFCEGDTIVLTNLAKAINYQWTGPNGFISTNDSIIIFPAAVNNSGTYSLTTITDGGCVTNGSATVSVIENKLTVDLPDTTTLLCDNATITFTAGNPFITKWQWSTGALSESITVQNTGMYWVKVQDIACTAADTTFVRTNRTPAVNFGKDTTVCFGEELLLNVFDPAAEFYLWNDNATDTVRLITTSGLYEVTLANECGQASDDIAVTVDENCANQVFVPTAFTPNNDGRNDVLRARAYFPISNFSFNIYNRWGQLIFSTANINEGWDGKINAATATPGVYIWQLSYKRKETAYKQKGTTVLIR